jgi:hypothetical protein
MKLNRSIWKVIVLLYSIALFACGGGGSSSTPTTSISGVVAKGLVNDATVQFFNLKSDGTKGDLLGSTTTNQYGSYNITLTISSGFILAEASGGYYTNEVSGYIDDLLSSDILSAVFSVQAGKSTWVVITPLTHMAASRARVMAASGMALATAVGAANSGVAQQYHLRDILYYGPADANNATDMQWASREQRNYGIVLAGITQEAASLNVRPIDLAAALATDMGDGILNGWGQGQNSISVPTINNATLTLPATAGTSDVQNAINTFLASSKNLTNLAGMDISTQPVNINPAGGTFYIAAGALPAWTEGQSGTATIPITGGTPPYNCGWTQGSQPPNGMTYDLQGSNLILTWTPPLLASGSTMSITPPFSMTCSDSKNLSQAIQWTATVVPTPPQVNFLQFSSPAANASYNQQIAQGTNCIGSCYCALETMGGFPPMGLTLNPDCTLSGTPTTAGSTTFGVCVVDSVGDNDCENVTVTVNAATPSPTPTPTPSPTSSGGCSGTYSWYNMSCTSASCASFFQGLYNSSTGPFCTSSDCTAWAQKYNVVTSNCSSAALYTKLSGTPINGCCAQNGVDF